MLKSTMILLVLAGGLSLTACDTATEEFPEDTRFSTQEVSPEPAGETEFDLDVVVVPNAGKETKTVTKAVPVPTYAPPVTTPKPPTYTPAPAPKTVTPAKTAEKKSTPSPRRR